MIVLWFILGFMGLCAAALVVRPFLITARDESAGPGAADALRADLREIDAALARGDMDADSAAAARVDAERRLLRATENATPEKAPAPADRRPAALIGAVVIIGAIGLYVSTGRPDLINPQPSPEAAARAELADVTATLEQKLKTKSDDPEGWRALGWAYFIAGDYDKSIAAYQKAIGLRDDVPAYHSAYGEALVGKAVGKVSPEALTAFKRARTLDPKDVRARFYIGLDKAQRGDAKAALDDWFVIYGEAPPGSPAADELRQQIETLAQQAGIDVSARFAVMRGPSAEDVEGAAQLTDQERAAMIDAMVTTLDRRLKQNPNDLEGWIRLIHARVVQKKPDDAADVLARARAAFAGDRMAQQALDQAALESGLR